MTHAVALLPRTFSQRMLGFSHEDTMTPAEEVLTLARTMAIEAPKRGWDLACEQSGFEEAVRKIAVPDGYSGPDHLVAHLSLVGLELHQVVDKFIFAKPHWNKEVVKVEQKPTSKPSRRPSRRR